jgi:hypothetical protein
VLGRAENFYLRDLKRFNVQGQSKKSFSLAGKP